MTSERRHRTETPARVRRLADLQAAIDRDEIEMLFQPQIALADGTISGVEALARWRHPKLGELGPGRLFDIAARSNTVAALSRHVQDRALAIAAGWPTALNALRLSINVTSEDIAEPGFADTLMTRIARAGFALDRLTIEITEAGLIADLDRAAIALDVLRGRGIRVAIDDFGTGYSSLAYLKALPLDDLKLDAGFAQDVTGSEKARIVLGAVIRLARDLGLDVIAEGVETEAQRDRLAAEGCAFAQGFLFARALESDALVPFIAQSAA